MGHSHLSADQTKLFLLRFSTKRCIFQSLGTLCNFALLSNYGKKPVNSSLQLRIGGSIGCLNNSTTTNAFRLIFLFAFGLYLKCLVSNFSTQTNIKNHFPRDTNITLKIDTKKLVIIVTKSVFKI